MPLYEFVCRVCNHSFDLNMTITEKERLEAEQPITCKMCGSDNLEQLFGGLSIQTNAPKSSTKQRGSGCCGGTRCS